MTDGTVDAAELELLKKIFLFRGAEPDFVRRTAERGQCRMFRKGQIIYDREHYQSALGILLNGSVEVTKDEGSGRGLMLSVLETGSLFGAAALFRRGERYETVLTAREACRILFLPQPLVIRMMDENPGIARNYILYLSERIHFLNRKIDGLIAGDAEHRLARFLADAAGTADGGAVLEIDRSLTRLAETLDLGRASLYRALSALEEKRLIRRAGKTITIPEVRELSGI